VSSIRFVTLLTDYGLEDGFVAICHGVIAGICPDARIIDITHLVPPGDVRRGAAVLAQAVPYLPPGVHVAVVDPGVGTTRRAVAVDTGERVFVGPDNGVLSWAVGDRAARAYELTNPKLWLEPVSATFHGRDVFAPVAGHLAAGLELPAVGEPIDPDGLVALPQATRQIRGGGAEGEVLTVDRFGNVQTSIAAADLALIGATPGRLLSVTLGRRVLTVPYGETFGTVPPGELVAYADSAGYVAIAVHAGNAAQRLALPPGARVRVSVVP
jgi:S-adenosyl-L-methionine hydrolase (adenosine-forming)